MQFLLIMNIPGPVPSEPLLCKFADGGQKKRQSQGKYLQNGRPWTRDGETVSLWFFFMPDDSCYNCFFNIHHCFRLGTLISLLITCSFVFFPKGGMTLTYDPTTALQNGSVLLAGQIPRLSREWDHVVVTNEFMSLSAGSTPLPTASPLTGWLVRPPSPRTCIPLCPPTRYWGSFRALNLHS